MTQKTRTKSASKTGTASLEFDDFELQATMQNFLEEGEKETGKGIWNFATIAGMVMLFMGLTFVLQWIGLPIGSGLSEFAQNIIGGLPIIGGVLVTLVGFGYFVGDRKKQKRAERKQKREQKKRQKTSKKDMNDIHGGESFKTSFNNLRNDLDGDSSKNSSYSSSTFDSFSTDYGVRPSKKLMKSRSDKKWAGVCGGVAKYFGISSTVVRFIFVAAFFMGYGASLLIYFGLSLAMPKEPVEMMDDFDF